MKLYIAGGKGENGRNCFCLDDGLRTFLLDCGIVAENVGSPKSPYPNLKKDQIDRMKVVFLSHSHTEHTGGLTWLFEQGFSGIVCATKETFSHLNIEFPKKIKKVCLEDWNLVGLDKIFDLKIKFGKSGHCLGGVWILLKFLKSDKSGKSKKFLYTGDYSENTLVYKTKLIRNKKADFALIDCAYGNTNSTYEEYCNFFMRIVRSTFGENKVIVLPVPKNGRAVELLMLLNQDLPKEEKIFYADETLYKFFSKTDVSEIAEWYKIKQKKIKKIFQKVKLYNGNNFSEKKAIIFLSDPQLKAAQPQFDAKQILENGGEIILTGTVEKSTFAEALLASRKAWKATYPVHQNLSEVNELCEKNKFKKYTIFHSTEEKEILTEFEF